MQNDTQQFENMSRLEEAIRKSRGLSFLLSRALQSAGDPVNPNEWDVSGIHDLTDAVSDEVGKRFTEAFRSVVKPATVQTAETIKPAA